MRPLSPETLLLAWDRGQARHPIDRSVMLHAFASPELPADRVADVPVGVRNSALLRLRQATFGALLRATLDCPQCGERLEFEADAASLLGALDGKEHGSRPALFEVAGLRFRPPTSRDLAELANESPSEDGALGLVRRCLVEPRGVVDDGALASLVEEVEENLERVDPMSDPRLEFACVDCGHGWLESFDIAAYLWEEIDAHARRLLDDVHALARAYGWSERQILGLSAGRRAAYLERVYA